MINFQDYLTEAEATEKSKAIKHLTHLGGEAHYHGEKETQEDLDRLNELHKHLKGESSQVKNVGVKADGSPSFEMGYVKNPASGEKEFGVAYKGAARGYAFNQDQIKDKFGHSEGLASKMGQLLEHGHKVMSKLNGVVQGDFMGSKKDNTISEEGNKISHKENLIKYSYPKDSEEGKKLKKAKISIALHTRIDKEHPEYNIDQSKFKHSDDVHMFNNKLSARGHNYSEEDQKEFEKNFAKAKEHLGTIQDHDNLVKGHTEHLQTYINKTVREGTNPSTAGYKSHLKARLQKEVDKVSRPENKLKKSIAMKNMVAHVDNNARDFTHLFAAHKHMDKAKNVLLKSLENSEQNQEHTINGKETKPEGFVASYRNGSVTKVVNRSKEGFSGQNLNK
jgi:hypothetical protein